MSDNQETIKPVASKLYAEIVKSHGDQTGALVEALEIARRRAEIDQTERDWRIRHKCIGLRGELLRHDSEKLFREMCDEFGPQRAVHLLTAIERAHTRARWGTDLHQWRQRGELSVEAAAAELGLAVEDIIAIEDGSFSAGPEVMRLVRPALRLVRGENESLK